MRRYIFTYEVTVDHRITLTAVSINAGTLGTAYAIWEQIVGGVDATLINVTCLGS